MKRCPPQPTRTIWSHPRPIDELSLTTHSLRSISLSHSLSLLLGGPTKAVLEALPKFWHTQVVLLLSWLVWFGVVSRARSPVLLHQPLSMWKFPFTFDSAFCNRLKYISLVVAVTVTAILFLLCCGCTYRTMLLLWRQLMCGLRFSTRNSPSQRTSLRWGDCC